MVKYKHTQQQQVEAPDAILIQMFQTVPFTWSHFQAVPQFEDLKVLFKKTKCKITGKGEDLTRWKYISFLQFFTSDFCC